MTACKKSPTRCDTLSSIAPRSKPTSNLALYELYQDCSFQAKAKKDLAGASYVQVGMPVPAGSSAATATKKEMV